ncbi:MAG: hypothetical protein QNL62_18775 [Gammaproteobacteria bacterium]|nr:hypothetical protein [Gammaproteobacteria bacterium]
MDRRAFFTRSAKKVAQGATELLVKKVEENAAHWIRPPFAIDEINFLLTCTRCDQCITACPHQVIFPLPARLGAQVVSTPVLDLLNKSCHLCEDWPCVVACEAQALTIPDLQPESIPEGVVTKDDAESSQMASKTTAIEDPDLDETDEIEKQWPKIARVFINTKTCMPYNGPECGACRICPVPGAMIWDREKPIIDDSICTGCALCREACIVEPKAIIVQSKYKKTA